MKTVDSPARNHPEGVMERGVKISIHTVPRKRCKKEKKISRAQIAHHIQYDGDLKISYILLQKSFFYDEYFEIEYNIALYLK